VLHKANIMKMTDGMFLEEARKVRGNYPGIEYDEHIIDAALMRLVRDPTPFDIILCENLYGDLLSDMCAGMVGGLGVAPGANFGEDSAVFESVHGSAPDIAGKNLANPLALLMSATMMLNHIAASRGDDSCAKIASRIKTAYDRALAEGQTTADLGGKLGTREFTQAVIDRLG
jgi:isocitrate dehydrogenase (NAD+)